MKKSKAQIITEILEAKDLTVSDVYPIPFTRRWVVEIDENRRPLRGADNPIECYTYEELLKVLARVSAGYHNCPACMHPFSEREERAQFCENCRTDISEYFNNNQ